MPGYRMPERRAVLFSIALLAVLAGCATVTAQAITLHGPEQGLAGKAALIDVVLDHAPAGVSGYELSFHLSGSIAGEIVDVAFPAWAGISDHSPLPSSNVTIKAVDTGLGVQANASDIVLVTLTIQPRQNGLIDVDFDSVRIDADGGSSYHVDAGSPSSGENGTPVYTPAAPALPSGPASGGPGSGGSAAGGIPGNAGTATMTVQPTHAEKSPVVSPSPHHSLNTGSGTPAPGHAAGTNEETLHSFPTPTPTRTSMGWVPALIGIACATWILAGKD